MSAKRQPLTQQYGSVSFAGFDDKGTFSNVHLDSQGAGNKQAFESSKYRYMYQYQNERENVAPNIYPDLTSPMTALGQIHTIQMLEMENKRLQEVIFYVGTNNDKLLVQCQEQQRQISMLKTSLKKQKDEYESQMKRMKEMLNDKKSECESISKNSKRQIEMIEQENERIKIHIKSVIEKKNDQVFNLTRNKQVEIQGAKKDLEKIIDELKDQNRKDVDKLNIQVQRLQEELTYWKQKHSALQAEYQALDEGTQAQKINLLSENEETFNEIKQKYHRNKLLMLEVSQQQIQSLQESSQIQRDTYSTEIENLKQHIQILNHEYRQLLEQEANNSNNYEENLRGYEKMVQQLKNKNHKLCVLKQQQIQLLKVRTGALHESNLKAVESVYAPKIQFLADKIHSFMDQIQKLHEVLVKQIEKNSDLIRKGRIQDSKHQQDLKKLRLMYENKETMMKQQLLTEKSLIMQESARIIKNYEIKANDAKFSEQQIRKLRKQLEGRINQIQVNQKRREQERKKWESERQILLSNIKTIQLNAQKEVNQLKGECEDKTKQCQQLREEILKTIRETPLPDYNKYIQEIQALKKEIAEKNELDKQARDKVDFAEKKCRQYKEEYQKINLENEVVINEAKAQWDVISQKKLEDLQEFYKKKLQFYQLQKQELKHSNNELQNKITSIVERYKELESTLAEAMTTLERRTELERKVIMLGTDNNLVKNKQQLFEY